MTATGRARQYSPTLAVMLGALSPLLISRRNKRRYTCARAAAHAARAISVIFASGTLVISAQIQRDVDFPDLIRTPPGIQRTLEHCDGHPDFETALANWLEMAEPSSPGDRQAVRETSLRLLEDTTDRQLVLGLSDGLLRHALEDINRDPAIVAEELARALYADIGKAVRRQKSKATTAMVPAYGLGEDGTVTNERQASFLEDFLNLADPRVAHRVRPSDRDLGNSARNNRMQGYSGPTSRQLPLRLSGLEPNLTARNHEAVPQLEAVEYGFFIVAGAIAFGLVLLARARRRNRHERDELRTHLRHLNSP